MTGWRRNTTWRLLVFGGAVLLLLAGCSRPASTGRTMIFETLVVGQLGVNCFILADPETREGVVVDPGDETGAILAVIREKGITVKYILNTHGHFDHVGGNRKMVEATGAPLLIHGGDEPLLSLASRSATMYGLRAENSPPPARHLMDGQVITFGTVELRVIHTPGHSPGGCCFYLPGAGKLISGDTLFAESIGRTDLAGGSHGQLITSITAKLLPLPDETRVYPGHGPSTTIGHEKRHNPYLGS
jgi:glyoxylase-like metal-dependent hydrolase (beta-lactamase superfamily II)